MMREEGIPPISHASRRRGGLRGTGSSGNGIRAPDREHRKIRWTDQDPDGGTINRENGRSTRGSAVPKAPASSKLQAPAKPIARRGAVSQQIANHIQGPPHARRSSTSRADYASYKERYEKLKESRKHERSTAIANGTLSDPNKKVSLAEAITIVGTCPHMCPEFERVQRTVERDVKPEEKDDSRPDTGIMSRIPDESKMVKKFTRSAAGQEEQLPSDLRPPHILRQTLDYLFDVLIGNATTLAKVHHFVWDRTRAIRNDFSIQQVTKLEDIRLAMDTYERIARFLILSLHDLADPDRSYHDYSAQQDREQLDKTILSLADYYEDNKNQVQSPNEPEFRAYQILFQIQNPTPDLENRVKNWPPRVQKDQRVQSALRIYTAACNIIAPKVTLKPHTSHEIAHGHWASFWNLVDSFEVTYLMGCVAEIYFQKVRFEALRSLWRIYRPRNSGALTSDWTLSELKPVLGLQTEEEVRNYCKSCGFSIKTIGNGTAAIDLGSVLGTPSDPSLPQARTELVESKRNGRALPVIMNGNAIQHNSAQKKKPTSSMFVTDDSDEEPSIAPHTNGQTSFGRPASATPSGFPSANPAQPAASFGLQSQAWSPNNGISFGSSVASLPFGTSSDSQTLSAFNATTQPPTASFGETSNTFGSNSTSPFVQQRGTEAQANGFQSKSLFDRVSGTPTAGENATSPFSTAIAPQGFPGFSAGAHSPAPVAISSSGKGNSSNPSATSTTNKNSSQALIFPATQALQPQLEHSLLQSSIPQPSPSGFSAATDVGKNASGPFPNAQGERPTLAVNQEHLANMVVEEQCKEEQRRREQEQEQQRQYQRVAEEARQREKARKQEEAKRREEAEQERRAQELVAHVKAERQAQEEETIDDLARSLLLGPNGFLAQYVEYNVGPLIDELQRQGECERLIKEADGFRLSQIMCRYGRRWRDICWKNRLARQGRERRKRQQRDAISRQRQEQERSISAELDAFRQSLSKPQAPIAQPQAQSDRQILENDRLSHAQGSSANSDLRYGRPHTRSASTPQASSQAGQALNSTRDKTSDDASTVINRGFRSSLSTFAGSKKADRPEVSQDTTRSDYFRLKAMGIQPPSSSLAPAKPASAYRARGTGLKRPRESESNMDLRASAARSSTPQDFSVYSNKSSMPPPSKRPATQAEVEANLSSSASISHRLRQQDENEVLLEQIRQARKAMSDSIDFFREEMDEMKRESARTSRSGSIHRQQDEDEVLLEQIRQTRKAMSDSIDFFREEIDEMKRESARTSRSGSIDRQPDSVERAKRSLQEHTRHWADESVNNSSTLADSTSGRTSVAQPLKYRSRASKLPPREEYTDMIMQRQSAGVSPREASRASLPVHTPRRYREPEQLQASVDRDPAVHTAAQRLVASGPSIPQPTSNRLHHELPADLLSSQSRLPSHDFSPNTSLNELIGKSTAISDKAPDHKPKDDASLTTTHPKPFPNGNKFSNHGTADQSTPFLSNASSFQAASSSSRPGTSQFAPMTSSPPPPQHDFYAQNEMTSTKPNAAGGPELQQNAPATQQALLSSSPGPETGTQRHERLQAMGENGTNGIFNANATPISPPRPRKPLSAGFDHNVIETTGLDQSQCKNNIGASRSQRAPKRQKQATKLKRNPTVNAFAALADEEGDNAENDDKQSPDFIKDGSEALSNHDHSINNATTNDDIATSSISHDHMTSDPPFPDDDDDTHPNNQKQEHDHGDSKEVAVTDDDQALGYGQNGDYGTSSLTSEEEELEEDSEQGSEYERQRQKEHRRRLKKRNDIGDYDNEIEEEEDMDREEYDEDGEIYDRDEREGFAPLRAYGENHENDQAEDEDEEDEREQPVKQNIDFGGKTGASVEDAIEL